MTTQKPSVVYRYKNGLYVNLTNRCPTDCVFCIKNEWTMNYNGNNLNLAGEEPSPETILKLAGQAWTKEPFKEFVFCGYGEPTMRLPELLACARLIKTGIAAPLPRTLRIRLNTNGLANAIWHRNVIADMKGLVDSVNVSLNTAAPDQWLELMRPRPALAATGFEKVKEFIRAAARTMPETFVTTVQGNGVDLITFRALAEELGAAVRIRGRLNGAGRTGAGPLRTRGGVQP